MENTFWTLIDNEYYRIHNGNLKYAPMCSDTSKILTDEEEKVEVISPELLERINYEFRMTLCVDDIV